MFKSCCSFAPRAARALLPWLLAGQACVAQAMLVTFDDLPPPSDNAFDSTPITDQYEPLGLVVQNGYLAGGGGVGGSQSLLGTPYFALNFVGTLPTYVSLYVSAPNQDKVWVTASGPAGFHDEFATVGWGPPEWSTAYRPNQYVSFHSASGISQLNLDAFYFLRVGAVVDNLYFGNVPAVPEPASAAALLAGLLVLAAAARLTRRRSSRETAAAPRSR